MLKVYGLIHYHKKYERYKRTFFIDRDFDPSVENGKIYETPCYSIENLYVGKKTFEEILKSECGLTEADKGFDDCILLYEALKKDFLSASTLFNAWHACLIEIRHSTNQQTNIKLADNIPKEFIHFSLSGVIKNYDIHAIRAKFQSAAEAEDAAIENKIAEFERQDKEKIFRGKFVMDFMLKILEAFMVDSKKDRKFLLKEIKYHITHTQAISQFSQ